MPPKKSKKKAPMSAAAKAKNNKERQQGRTNTAGPRSDAIKAQRVSDERLRRNNPAVV
jgi:hypothetical protein